MKDWDVAIVHDDLTPTLRKMGDNIRVEVINALVEIAQRMVTDAGIIVPVRTGFLRSTIFSRISGSLEVEIGASAPYAQFIEFGTFRMAAQPYLRPAILGAFDDLCKAVLDGVMRGL